MGSPSWWKGGGVPDACCTGGSTAGATTAEAVRPSSSSSPPVARGGLSAPVVSAIAAMAVVNAAGGCPPLGDWGAVAPSINGGGASSCMRVRLGGLAERSGRQGPTKIAGTDAQTQTKYLSRGGSRNEGLLSVAGEARCVCAEGRRSVKEKIRRRPRARCRTTESQFRRMRGRRPRGWWVVERRCCPSADGAGVARARVGRDGVMCW